MDSLEVLDSDNRYRFPIIKCANCTMIWLVPGLKQGDTYECKRCGVSLVLHNQTDNDSHCQPDVALAEHSASNEKESRE